MNQLNRLAMLIKERNKVEVEITAIINRPVQIGHIGEYIADAIFDLTLHPAANNKGSDGHFASGPLAGRSVNVKWYGKLEYILDVNPDPMARPNYYLVFTGPYASASLATNVTRPWVIHRVYLFDATALVNSLTVTKTKLGVATGVKKALWDAAEIYPNQSNALLPLMEIQRAQLDLFREALPGDPSHAESEPNPYLATAGLFAGDSFAEDVEAFIAAERQREREEAASEAIG